MDTVTPMIGMITSRVTAVVTTRVTDMRTMSSMMATIKGTPGMTDTTPYMTAMEKATTRVVTIEYDLQLFNVSLHMDK